MGFALGASRGGKKWLSWPRSRVPSRVDMKALSPKLLAPGCLLALPLDEDTSVLLAGHAVGWFAPEGIRAWDQELSVVRRSDLRPELRARLALVLPEDQIAVARFPLSHEAAAGAQWLAVTPSCAAQLREADVRVQTLGADKLTSRLVYEARGGGPDRMFECDLVEFASAVSGELARNEVLSKALVLGIDRLLRGLTGGAFGEYELLLAARLPRLCNDGSGLSGVSLESFEQEAASARASLAPFGSDVAELALVLGQAASTHSCRAPLFGTAERRLEAARAVTLGAQTIELPACTYWVVAGLPARERTVDAKSVSTPSLPLANAEAPVAREDLDHLRRVVSQAPAQAPAMEVSAMLEDAVREAASAAPAAALVQEAAAVEHDRAVVADAAPALPATEHKDHAGLQTRLSDAPQEQAAHAGEEAGDSEPGQGLWFVLLLIGVAYFIWRGR